MQDHIVMLGDPVSGFKFFGPFTKDEAYTEFTRLNGIAAFHSAVWVVPLATKEN